MHALMEIAESANASDVKADKVHNFRTALLHKIATSLYAAFGQQETNARTQCIIDAALQGLTPQEFDGALKHAQSMAKAADASLGWNPGEKKGRKAYGPKESTFASAASEKRQVFGVARLNLQVLVHTGPNGVYDPQKAPAWAQALTLAREYLKANGIDWTGARSDDLRKMREQRSEVKATNAAMDQARMENPQEPGETLADYMIRIAKATEENLSLAREKAYAEECDRIAAKLIKDHGLEMAVDIAERIYKALDALAEETEAKSDPSKADAML